MKKLLFIFCLCLVSLVANATIIYDWNTFFATGTNGAINTDGTHLEKTVNATFGLNTWIEGISLGASTANPTVQSNDLTYKSPITNDFNYIDNSAGKKIVLPSTTPAARNSYFVLSTSSSTYTSGTWYLTALVNIAAAPSTAANFLSFIKTNTTGNERGTLKIKSGASSGFALSITMDGSPTSSNTSDLAFGTHLIVIKYTINSNFTDGAISLFVDPVLGVSEPSATLTQSDTGITNATNFKLIEVYQQAGLGANVAGLRFGTTWSDATTPSSPTVYTVSGTNTLCPGSTNITLSGSQTGVSYQLYKDGISFGSAAPGTGSSLNWSVSSTGTYTVKATISGLYTDIAMSSNAVVTIKTAPNITGSSLGTATYGQNYGSPTPLSVTVSGYGLSYQWYSSTDNSTSTSGDDVTVGTNSNSFSPPTTNTGILYYYCVISGDCSYSTTSSPSGAITITESCTAPIFSTQPIDGQSECIGGTTTLGTVVADYTNYQWYSVGTKTNSGGSSVSSGNGGNTATYTPPSTTAGIYYYYVVASNGGCSTASNAVQITINTTTAINSQSTATASYSLNYTPVSALTVSAVGANLTYQWYSNSISSNSGGTSVGSANGGTTASFTPPVTSIGTTYYYCIVSGSCSSATSAVSGAINVVSDVIGDLKSITSGLWSATTTWNKWNGTAWVTATAAPTSSNNVTIQNGHTITLNGTPSCYNLTINSGAKLFIDSDSSTPLYVTIYGTSLVCNGTFGDKMSNGTTDSGTGIRFTGNLTISGSGGTVRPFKISPAAGATNASVTFDTNTELTYTSSGLISEYNSSDNITYTVNSGKTVNLLGSFSMASSAAANGLANTTIYINGTMNVVKTLNLTTSTGKLCTLNVNGSLTTTNLNVTPTTAVLAPVINIGSGGTLTVNGTADFSSTSLAGYIGNTPSTTGGTFILAKYGNINIANSSGLEPSAGPIRTTTRTFNTTSNYTYVGTTAQVTGSDLPATVNNLTCNNTAGLTLSAATTVTDSLTLKTGTLTTTPGLTFSNTGAIIRQSGSLSAVPTFGTTVNIIYGGTYTTQSSSITTSSSSVTLSAANANISVGMPVSGTGITAGTTVQSISGTALTLSQNATATNTSTTLSFGYNTAQTSGYELPTSSTVLSNLTINNLSGVTLGADKTVNGILALTSGTLYTGANTLTLKAGKSGTGTIDGASGTIVYNGASSQTTSTLANVNNLTINNSANVTLGAATTVNGTLDLTAGVLTNSTNNVTLGNGATISRTTGTLAAVPVFGSTVNLTYSGSTATTPAYEFPASAAITTLTVNNTAGLSLTSSLNTTANLTIGTGGILNLNAGKQLTVSTALANNGTINLLSDASGTATILTPTIITGSGTATVQQYLSSSRNWYMSSPVSGATGLPTVDSGSLIFYSYPENDANQSASGAYWNTVSSGTMTVGTGYIVKPSVASTITFSGTSLNTGDKTISGLTNSTTNNPLKHGFNLIGNPYPSYLNVLPALNGNSNLETTVWYRTRDTNTTPLYHFETVNATTGVGTNASGTGRVSGYIPPMQAFWIRTKVDNQSITLLNSNRSHAKNDVSMTDFPNTPTTSLKAPSTKQSSYSLLGLNISNGSYGDETIVMFDPAASNGLDAYDSGKMSNGNINIPELFTVVGGSQLAINGMNNIPYDTEIPLGFTTGLAGTFTIKASQINNFDSSTSIYLKDNDDLLNTPVQLNSDAVYSFSSAVTTNNTSRFALIFKAPSIATSLNPMDNSNVWISTNANNQIVVNGGNSVEVYNAVGQKLAVKNLNATTTVLETPLQSGVYFVAVGNGAKSLIRKVIIK